MTILNDILRRVVRAGRPLHAINKATADTLIARCKDLLSDRAEVSGLATAAGILDGFEDLPGDQKIAFFGAVAARFGVDQASMAAAIAAWSEGDDAAARAIHDASEPRCQELIRRLNRVPGGTARLVAMRGTLLGALGDTPELAGLDEDFRHLLSSWFNRGFLEIRRIDWTTAAEILEKIIGYEAVHEIAGWDDLRRRVAAPDRRLFAFFHPAMPSEPLIFVEVALTNDLPRTIASILSDEGDVADPVEASTAVFYSISNCQKGLRGISFGNFLIKQVMEELLHELPGLRRFATLSPVPGLRRWVDQQSASAEPVLPKDIVAGLEAPGEAGVRPPELAAEVAAIYLTSAKSASGSAHDPVAHFHLGNGAVLHRIHAEADLSARAQADAWGVMVNYLYDGDRLEANHQRYAGAGEVATSSAVRDLARHK